MVDGQQVGDGREEIEEENRNEEEEQVSRELSCVHIGCNGHVH